DASLLSSAAMTAPDYIFIDNGGVMTDNTRRSGHYRRLVGEFFVPRYGGRPETWEEANLNTFWPAWQLFLQRVADWDGSRSIVEPMDVCFGDWTRFLFDAAGVPVPDAAEGIAVGREAERWINPQVVTLFDGVE